MVWLQQHSWVGWLVIGLMFGAVVGSFWPDTPLHATATDRVDSFAVATGPVDESVEAIYYLDALTGTLKAAVLSSQSQDFQARYQANVYSDLQTLIAYINKRNREGGRRGEAVGVPEIQIPTEPNYILVTGLADVRGSMARKRPGLSVVYVAETNTGIVMAYVLPWDKSAHSANQPVVDALVFWAGDQFSTAIVRSQ